MWHILRSLVKLEKENGMEAGFLRTINGGSSFYGDEEVVASENGGDSTWASKNRGDST
jgi:hypothetical protein